MIPAASDFHHPQAQALTCQWLFNPLLPTLLLGLRDLFRVGTVPRVGTARRGKGRESLAHREAVCLQGSKAIKVLLNGIDYRPEPCHSQLPLAMQSLGACFQNICRAPSCRRVCTWSCPRRHPALPAAEEMHGVHICQLLGQIGSDLSLISLTLIPDKQTKAQREKVLVKVRTL